VDYLREDTSCQFLKQHAIFVLFVKTSLDLNLNRLWEIEPVEQSSLTPEQQACEHTSILTLRNNMEDL
jgi:hypothetical protein